ncbi:MAG: 2-C-methyl-D-erythritol 4-phosphate cytidylyltransferase [Clostridia bacterium]|nr:2-C-methyl-D-erythritol 4-phosphate cytidylyltransferase [Clostridia bacterium]
MNTLLLMMGGSGTRMGAARPKQYIEINGKPVFWYIVKGYASIAEIDHICIVSHADWVPYVRDSIRDIAFREAILVTPGGENRSQSIRNGLHAIEPFSQEEDVVMMHDATHPYVDREGTLEIIQAVKTYGGATLGARQYDTCYRMDEALMLTNVIPRQEIVSGASPEAFRYGDMKKIYFGASDEELASMTSAGAIALAHQIPMKVVPTKILNLKLTYPEDLELFRTLLDGYFLEGKRL